MTSKRQQAGRNIGEIIVLGMPKATPDADDESAQLARMERLCSALDVVREESEREGCINPERVFPLSVWQSGSECVE